MKGADQVPLVKYVGNATPEDTTSELKLSTGKVVERDVEVDLTPEEFAEVAGRYQFEVLDSAEPAAEPTPAPSPLLGGGPAGFGGSND